MNKNIIFDDMPYSALPIYNVDPDMFVNEKMEPQAYFGQLIPPRIEIAKKIKKCDVFGFHRIRGKVVKDFKKRILKIANCFLKAGLKTVIVSLYPVAGVGMMEKGKTKSMMAIGNFCMVAYKDEIKLGAK